MLFQLKFTYTQTTGFQCRFHSRTTVGQLFGNDATRQNIQSHSANFLWNVTIKQTNAMCFFHNFPWIFTSFIELRCDRNNFITCEFTSNILKLFLFIAQFEWNASHRICTLNFGQTWNNSCILTRNLIIWSEKNHEFHKPNVFAIVFQSSIENQMKEITHQVHKTKNRLTATLNIELWTLAQMRKLNYIAIELRTISYLSQNW